MGYNPLKMKETRVPMAVILGIITNPIETWGAEPEPIGTAQWFLWQLRSSRQWILEVLLPWTFMPPMLRAGNDRSRPGRSKFFNIYIFFNGEGIRYIYVYIHVYIYIFTYVQYSIYIYMLYITMKWYVGSPTLTTNIIRPGTDSFLKAE